MLHRTSVLSSFTLWFVVLALIAAAIQVTPAIGIIYLMLGGPFLNMLLIYAIVGGFILDCLIGPFPRFGLVLPVLGLGAFGLWYKGEYDKNRASISDVEAQLQNRNTGEPFAFDPRHQALVYDNSRALLQYALPTIYILNSSKGSSTRYFKLGIKARRDCRPTPIKNNPAEFLTQSVNILGPEQGVFCLTRTAADPFVPLVAIDTNHLPSETIAGQKLDLNEIIATYNGSPVVRRITATTRVLPAFPIFAVGCFLIDNPPAWKCGGDFLRQTIMLDTIPGPETFQSLGELGSVLALKPRTNAEIADLTAR